MMNLIKDSDRFNRLMEALESGWEIEEPVLTGPPGAIPERNGGSITLYCERK